MEQAGVKEEAKSADWTVRLVGDDRSLQRLSARFTQGRHKIGESEDGHHYLTSPALTACGTEDEAWNVAERIVDRVNSAAKVIEPRHASVHVGALERTGPDGNRRSFERVRLGAARGIRCSAEVVRDGKVVAEASPPTSAEERIVDLQEREGRESEVVLALEQWSLPEQTPTSLNNILEAIRDNVAGGMTGKQAWRTTARLLAPALNMSEPQLNDELKRCRDSLHDYAAVGPTARHSSPRHVDNPMDLSQAKRLVHLLLVAWLEGKV